MPSTLYLRTTTSQTVTYYRAPPRREERHTTPIDEVEIGNGCVRVEGDPVADSPRDGRRDDTTTRHTYHGRCDLTIGAGGRNSNAIERDTRAQDIATQDMYGNPAREASPSKRSLTGSKRSLTGSKRSLIASWEASLAGHI